MRLRALQNYASTSIAVGKLISGLKWLCLELSLRIGAVYLWNWIVSVELNKFLFGEEKLDLLKGVISVSVLLFLNALSKQALITNNITNREK